MDVILNLWHEQLHDIFISTMNGRKLRLRIFHDKAGYHLAGEFYEIENRSWYRVDFSKLGTPSADTLFSNCLEDLKLALQSKSDFINEIHNTSNKPMVSIDRQKEISDKLDIMAQFRLN